MAVNTPLASVQALRATLRKGRTHEVPVNSRVLRWLLDDAERLNQLEARAIESGFETLEDALFALSHYETK